MKCQIEADSVVEYILCYIGTGDIEIPDELIERVRIATEAYKAVQKELDTLYMEHRKR